MKRKMIALTTILMLGLSVSAYFANTMQVYAESAEKQTQYVGCPFLKAIGSGCGEVRADTKNSKSEEKSAIEEVKSIQGGCCADKPESACSKDGVNKNNPAKCSSRECSKGCNCKQASSGTIMSAKCSNENCKCGSSCNCGSSCKC